MITSEITTIVRNVMDLNEDDLPLSLIQTYLRDGFERIINLERRWSFLQASTTLSTIPNQRSYVLADIGANDLEEIVSIVDQSDAGNKLTLIGIDEAERIWHGVNDSASRPLAWTKWGGTIDLYPKPDVVYPLSIRGYRKPFYAWVRDNTLAPDCDDRFHIALAYYAISQAYKRQEDVEMSQVYKQSFDEAVMLARKELMRPDSARPVVLSRGYPMPSDSRWLWSLGRSLGGGI